MKSLTVTEHFLHNLKQSFGLKYPLFLKWFKMLSSKTLDKWFQTYRFCCPFVTHEMLIAICIFEGIDKNCTKNLLTKIFMMKTTTFLPFYSKCNFFDCVTFAITICVLMPNDQQVPIFILIARWFSWAIVNEVIDINFPPEIREKKKATAHEN